MAQINTVIFDVDGTLIDTFQNCIIFHKAYHIFFPERQVPLEVFQRAHSLSHKKSMEAVGILPEEHDEFWEFYIRYYREHAPKYPLFDGIESLVERLDEKGYTLGVNTARGYEALLDSWTLYQEEIFFRFNWEYCVHNELAKNPKPAPDPLELLCEKQDLSVENLVFIGDSHLDYYCAKSANVLFCWASWGWHFDSPLHKDGIVLTHPHDLLKVLEER